MSRMVRALALIAVVAAACAGALGAPAQLGNLTDADAIAREYRLFLDAGRVPADLIDHVVAKTGWTVVDVHATTQPRTKPGDRLVFVDRNRMALFVVVGKRKLATDGARLVCGHIDTPAPKVRAYDIRSDRGEAHLVADSYGGLRRHQWVGIPVDLVGRVVAAGGREIAVDVGPLFVVEQRDDELVAVAASTPPQGKGGPALTFIEHLHERYGLTEPDLIASELYLVPDWPARDVGVDHAFIGAHGHDDRVNSYAAWRAITDVRDTPARTAIAWLVDREEVGSTGPTGARSDFIDLVYAYLLRAEGSAADERTLAGALAASDALSSDTPAALNPNFPEAHVARIAPTLGDGVVMFPYAGSGGKQGSHTARAELIRNAQSVFAAAGAPLQAAELGAVDAGGGGTISNYLGERGMDVLDLGIPVVNMHSPFELVAKQDLWSGYLGFRAWLRQ